MKYLRHEFTTRTNQHVKVTFQEPVGVLVMNDKNFDRYKNGMSCTYFGGHQEVSPFRINVNRGKWHVVIDVENKDPKSINPTIKVIDPTLEYTPPIFNELEFDLKLDNLSALRIIFLKAEIISFISFLLFGYPVCKKPINSLSTRFLALGTSTFS